MHLRVSQFIPLFFFFLPFIKRRFRSNTLCFGFLALLKNCSLLVWFVGFHLVNVTVTLFNTKKKHATKNCEKTVINGVKTESGFCSKTFFPYIFHLICIVLVKKVQKICLFFSFFNRKNENLFCIVSVSCLRTGCSK